MVTKDDNKRTIADGRMLLPIGIGILLIAVMVILAANSTTAAQNDSHSAKIYYDEALTQELSWAKPGATIYLNVTGDAGSSGDTVVVDISSTSDGTGFALTCDWVAPSYYHGNFSIAGSTDGPNREIEAADGDDVWVDNSTGLFENYASLTIDAVDPSLSNIEVNVGYMGGKMFSVYDAGGNDFIYSDDDGGTYTLNITGDWADADSGKEKVEFEANVFGDSPAAYTDDASSTWWTGTSSTYTIDPNVNEDTSINITAYDVAGNTDVHKLDFYMDNDAPTTTLGFGQSHVNVKGYDYITDTTQTFIFATDDAGHSNYAGLNDTEYKEAHETEWTSYSGPFTKGIGIHQLQFNSTDYVENKEVTNNQIVNVGHNKTAWTVSASTVEHYNDTVIFCSNLNVQGTLILENVTLVIYATGPGIQVQDGGQLFIWDNDNNSATTNDASVLMGMNSVKFDINVHNGGTLHAMASTFHRVEIMMYDSNITVESCMFEESGEHIRVFNSFPRIANNTFTDPLLDLHPGVMVHSANDYRGKPLEIVGNSIKGTRDIGLYVDGGSFETVHGTGTWFSGIGDSVDSELEFSVNIKGTKNPILYYWDHCDDLTDANGDVKLSTDGGQTFPNTLKTLGSSSSWRENIIDLRQWNNDTVNITFEYQTFGAGNDYGWLIDEIRVVEYNSVNNAVHDLEYSNLDDSEFNNFKNMWVHGRAIDYYSTHTADSWEIGTPTSTSGGPTGAHSGNYCWGTDLDANTGTEASYLELNTSFISAGENLTFYHWYNCGGARVEISTDLGLTWNILDNSSTVYNFGSIELIGGDGFAGDSGGWVLTGIDMDPYWGKEVMIRFAYYNDGPDGGWFIDDIRYEVLAGRTSLVHENAETTTTSLDADGFVCTAPGVVRIENNKIYNVTTGILVEDSMKTVASNNEIGHEDNPDPDRYGIVIDGSSAVVSSNTIEDVDDGGWCGIWIDSNNLRSTGVQAIGNSIKGYNGTDSGIHIQKGSALVSSNTIQECNFGIYLYSGYSPIISDNTIIDSYLDGISLKHFLDPVHVTVDGNDISGCGNNGINAMGYVRGTISNNDVDMAAQRISTGAGIRASSYQYMQLTGNTVMNSEVDGIRLEKHSSTYLYQNSANNNGRIGLYIKDGAEAWVSGTSGNMLSTFDSNELGIFVHDEGPTLDGPITEFYYIRANSNDHEGMRLYNFTGTLEDCYANSNKDAGIYLKNPVGAIIKETTCDTNFDDGILIEGGEDVVLNAVVTNQNANDGVRLYRTSVASFIGSSMTNNLRHGVNLYDDWAQRDDLVVNRGQFNDTTIVEFTDNIVSTNTKNGVYIHYDANPTSNVWTAYINNNDLSYNGLYDLDGGEGIFVDWEVYKNVVTSNTIRRFDGTITVTNGRSIVLSNANIEFLESGNGVFGEVSSSITFDSVTMDVAEGKDDFTFSQSGTTLAISHSTITDASSIYVKPVLGACIVTVTDTVISGGTSGLYLDSALAEIEETTIDDMQFYGIYAKETRMEVEDTTIKNCNQAIYSFESADDASNNNLTMSGSTITMNDQGVILVENHARIYNSTLSNTVTDLDVEGGRAFVYNTSLDKDKCEVLDGASYIERYWYLDVHIQDEYGDAMDNTYLLVKDGKDATVLSKRKVTGSSVLFIPCKEYRQTGTSFDYGTRLHFVQTDAQSLSAEDKYLEKNVTMDRSKSVVFVYNLGPKINDGVLPTLITTNEDIPVYGAFYPYNAFTDTGNITITITTEGDFTVSQRTDLGYDLIPDRNQFGTGKIWVKATDDEGDSTTVKIDVTIISVNDAPVISNVTIYPSNPKAGMDMTIRYDYYDVEEDAVGVETYLWFQKTADGTITNFTQATIGTHKKGEEWYCVFKVTDDAGSKYSNVVTTETIVIGNSVPVIDSAFITPASGVTTNTNLEAGVSGWYDIDKDVSDTKGLLYQWQIHQEDEWLDIPGATGKTLTSDNFVKGDEIRVVVTPYEDSDIGVSRNSDSIKVQNSAPVITSIGIDPEQPTESTSKILALVTATDPDGDEIFYRFRWTSGNGAWGGQEWTVGNGSGENQEITSTIISFWVGNDVTLVIEVRDRAWARGEDATYTFTIEPEVVEVDTDNDGIPDTLDSDDDGDGWSDTTELELATDPLDNRSKPSDFDGDMIPDALDEDDDNDGWSDLEEIRYGTNPKNANEDPDADNNGIADAVDNTSTDGAGGESISFGFQVLLIVLLVLIFVILFAASVFLLLRSRIMPMLGLEDEDEGPDYDALIRAMGDISTNTKLLPAAAGPSVNVDGVDLSALDLNTELVECGACGELVPETISECPHCGAEFDDDIIDPNVSAEEDEMMADLEEDSLDEYDDLDDDWEDEPKPKKKKGKKKKGKSKKGKKRK